MKKNFLILTIISVLSLISCKPTEKGYKSAYDAALNKRQAALADLDVTLGEGELQEIDGMNLKTIDGIKVYLMNQRLKPVSEGAMVNGPYFVGVSRYKMITNSNSQVSDLCEKGYDAFVAVDSDDLYYSIAGSFKTLEEAVNFYQKYREGKNRVYVGLHDAPVIIYSPN